MIPGSLLHDYNHIYENRLAWTHEAALKPRSICEINIRLFHSSFKDMIKRIKEIVQGL